MLEPDVLTHIKQECCSVFGVKFMVKIKNDYPVEGLDNFKKLKQCSNSCLPVQGMLVKGT